MSALRTGALLAVVGAGIAAGLVASCSGKENSSGSDSGGGSTGLCQVCDAGCSNGLVTICVVLDPPGCGAQSETTFCPYGCSDNAPDFCNFNPVDGAAPPGCIASEATPQSGSLQGGDAAPVAVTVGTNALEVIVATSAAAACASSGGDAGALTAQGSGAVLTIPIPARTAGTVSAAGARLTVWKNGTITIDGETATSGSLVLNVNAPGDGGGAIGSYDITFGTDIEQGSFVAPACDICKAADGGRDGGHP
jgi:hypothetical protein